MVDVASIILAVISLVSSIIVAGVGSWLTYNTDKRKARREAEKLLQKYRDPLLFAAEDLQSRLWGLLETHVLTFHDGAQNYQDALYIYTAFVVGQFFAWTHILRRETQLLPFSLEEDARLKSFVAILHGIQGVMLTDEHLSEEGRAFTLWRGHQMAIGEFMATREEGSNSSSQRLCMGFYEFTRTWKLEEKISNPEERTMRTWFQPVVEGIEELVEKGREAPEGNRLRRLQHLLIDLIEVLDPSKQRLNSNPLLRCGTPRGCPCPCKQCSGTAVMAVEGGRKSSDVV